MTKSELYDWLYNEGEMIFMEYNLCDVYDGQCHADRIDQRNNSFCCLDCKHLSDTGCTVKALYCKLWFCDMWNAPHLIKRRLQILHDLAFKNKLLAFRASKRKSLNVYNK